MCVKMYDSVEGMCVCVCAKTGECGEEIVPKCYVRPNNREKNNRQRQYGSQFKKNLLEDEKI